MMPGMVSLCALASLLGVAPGVLRSTLSRAGVKLGSDDRASEGDLAKVFGAEAARQFIARLATMRRRGSQPHEPIE